jgi:hypothetical protein
VNFPEKRAAKFSQGGLSPREEANPDHHGSPMRMQA